MGSSLSIPRTLKDLRATGAIPHYFGLGFIQIKLDGRRRIHFWTPDWPVIPGADSEIHDHRYAFTSTVLQGALRHELYALGEVKDSAFPGSWEVVSVTCQPQAEQEPLSLGFSIPVSLGGFTVPAGSSYRLTSDAFHRSFPVGPTVTYLEREEVERTYARVFRIPGSSSVCPFSLNKTEEECWAKIAHMLC